MASNSSTSNRGLASADKETRARVARMGGQASHGGRGRGDSSGSNSGGRGMSSGDKDQRSDSRGGR